MPPPQNKKDVERFLYMVTYVTKFILNLSIITKELKQLIKKDVLFDWNNNHKIPLEKFLTSTPVLQYYNSNLPIVASKNGLGK